MVSYHLDESVLFLSRGIQESEWSNAGLNKGVETCVQKLCPSICCCFRSFRRAGRGVKLNVSSETVLQYQAQYSPLGMLSRLTGCAFSVTGVMRVITNLL